MASTRPSYTLATLALAGWLAATGSVAVGLPSRRPPRPPPAGALDARAMWIWYLARSDGGDLDRISNRARAAGVSTLLIKSGDGTNYWSQFTRGLVDALHARRLRVCAWQYVYGTDPAGEARTAERAVRAGAECLVIDAETEYEGRYASAQTYLRALRRGVGRGYPLGLASFPYVDYHPGFPYSVFLGPGGAQFDLPQMYWREIGGTLAAVFDHTYTGNRVFRRPIRPVGQTFGSPGAADLLRFRALTVRHGSPGISWWDFAWTSAAGLWSAVNGRLGAAEAAPSGWPRLHRGSRGDLVVWLQEHLASAFPALRSTGLFGDQTLAYLRAFQARRRLAVSGRADAATWRALLRLAPITVRWVAGGARQAAAARPGRHARPGSDRAGSALAPASASLPARTREIPELGSSRAGGAEPFS